MNKRGLDSSSFFIIIGAILILLWALLKAFNIINTPMLIEMIPYFGAGVSIIGVSYKLGKIKRGIEETENKVDKLIKIEDRFNKLESEHVLAMNGKLKIKH